MCRAVLQYFFFATVGAQLNFEMRTGSILGNSFIIVICALIFRYMAVFLFAIYRKYNNKERLYMAFSWISHLLHLLASIISERLELRSPNI
jgi:NhaP-type Na+/H+ or K+/H+ antiporter